MLNPEICLDESSKQKQDLYGCLDMQHFLRTLSLALKIQPQGKSFNAITFYLISEQ